MRALRTVLGTALILCGSWVSCGDRYTVEKGCDRQSECPVGFICSAGECTNLHCQDGRLDADEEDVDCGGTVCRGCLGSACASDFECASGHCTGGAFFSGGMCVTGVELGISQDLSVPRDLAAPPDLGEVDDLAEETPPLDADSDDGTLDAGTDDGAFDADTDDGAFDAGSD